MVGLKYLPSESEMRQANLLDSSRGMVDCMSFVVRFQLKEDIESPIAYGLMISNQKGVETLGSKAALYRKESLPRKRALCTMTLPSFDSVRSRHVLFCLPQLHTTTVVLIDEFLDYRFNALQFQVVGVTKSFATSIVAFNGELAHSIISG